MKNTSVNQAVKAEDMLSLYNIVENYFEVQSLAHTHAFVGDILHAAICPDKANKLTRLDISNMLFSVNTLCDFIRAVEPLKSAHESLATLFTVATGEVFTELLFDMLTEWVSSAKPEINDTIELDKADLREVTKSIFITQMLLRTMRELKLVVQCFEFVKGGAGYAN